MKLEFKTDQKNKTTKDTNNYSKLQREGRKGTDQANTTNTFRALLL